MAQQNKLSICSRSDGRAMAMQIFSNINVLDVVIRYGNGMAKVALVETAICDI
jgi:hypothetical protein